VTAISYTDQVLTGWGRTAPSRAIVGEPRALAAVEELVASRPARGVLGRGAGRSYGDAAQNASGYVIRPISPPQLEVDQVAATLHASAGTTFTEVLTATVPHGLLPPVLPGTRHLTIGGAVAADVHGKNHRRDGSIAAWVDEIELLDGSGTVRRLRPDHDRDAFLATTGGMGLTGIILAVTLRLLRVRSAMLEVGSRRLDDLDAVLAALEAASSRYSVAWIDTTAAGRSLGRGIVDTADHLPGPDPLREPDGLNYRPPRARRAPALPLSPVRPWSARGFNRLHFHRAPREHHGLSDLPGFFHKLDAVAGWNRAVGPGGLVQYQFVVPDGGEKLIARAIELVQRHGCAPFLGTLKRFGPASGGALSFPLPGWSIAIDMPAGRPGVGPALAELDHEVADAGGRVYLAKDSRLGRASFDEMYGPPAAWRTARAELDPYGVFQSDLGRRLGLCGS